MKSAKALAGILFVCVAGSTPPASGAGFGIYEGSARGNAMGTEVTADPASPAVLYNNPAAMTALPGTRTETGATCIRPHVTVKTQTPAGTVHSKADSHWWTPPHLYATHQLDERFWLGFGLFSRYGLGVQHDDNWPGRYNCQEAIIQSIDLNPSVACKLLDNLSLAAGLRAEWFEFSLDRALPSGAPFLDPDLQFHLRGDSWGLGYNLGLYYEATDRIAFGLAYESEIDQDVEGCCRVSHPNPALAGTSGQGDVTTPAIVRAGASFKATESWTLNAGVVCTLWSSYETLAIHFDPPLLGALPTTTTRKDWDDAFRFQVGAEYALDAAWALRAGYVFDESPIPDAHVDYIVPANDRHLFSFGVGYRRDALSCDLGYTYLRIEDRDVAGRPAEGVLPGAFTDGDAHMVSLSVGYAL